MSTSRRTVPSRKGRNRSSEDALASMAKALGHPARVAIMKLLIARGECLCGAIVNELPLAQATVSQHLKILKDAGLVQGEIDGPRVCYCANLAAVRRFKELIGDL
ncbi:MAG TPA: metalloregulator ArsR/SmtB family transcription factor [bacterium]|nr:metalloregulator ArsR/SmtB family transcription factor [bacterium]